MTEGEPRVRIVPYETDPLDWLADHLAGHFSDRLPDLSAVTVLVPDGHVAPQLRRALLTATATPAMLGPTVTTLGQWLETRPQPGHPRICAPHNATLMLVEALMESPDFFGEQPWQLAEALGRLFEDLTLNQAPPPERLGDFIERLRKGYGWQPPACQPLSNEAGLVHTLWQAWHHQLAQEGITDTATARVQQLAAGWPGPMEHIYLIDPVNLNAAERHWLDRVLVTGRGTLVLHGRPGGVGYHPDAAGAKLLAGLSDSAPEPAPPTQAYSQILDATFHGEGGALPERAGQCADRWPVSPLEGRLAIYTAPDAETEAHAVELQVRRWLIDGAGNVGVVTEDRRLARRIRALLERAGIVLADAGGWALSTTSAAAVLERWLETVEEDFRHEPLLDLLKSPFVRLADGDRTGHLETIYRFEHDIVQHQNIARGMARYRQAVHHRHHYHEIWQHLPETPTRILGLLEHIEAAAQPLRQRLDETLAPAAWLDALEAGLDALGLRAAFAEDLAGQRILDELAAMRAGLARRSLKLDWQGFRTWLGRTLERHYFRPGNAGGPVQLMALDQSALARFDRLIIAGATAEHLPGEVDDSPFFNDRVRGELGLAAWRDGLNGRFHRFRQLLEAAPRVLITTRLESEGRETVPSPWLEMIRAFHRLAYGDERDLSDTDLDQLVRTGRAHVGEGDGAPLPEPGPFPSPAAAADLVPSSFSASAYQDLMDCPYRFHAARCLKLKPPDRVREALEKSDYGGRVHRCLQSFHFGGNGCKAFGRLVTEENRDEAEAHLAGIAREIFARDLEDNFEHRGWLRRFEAAIPKIIQWEIQRAAAGWRASETEQSHERELACGAVLTGRPDRVDTHETGARAVVDYKTGAIPAKHEVQSAEDVQLVTYAALLEEVSRVEFVDLDNEVGRGKHELENDTLAKLTHQSIERLNTLVQSLRDGAAVPAWGDTKTCQRCDMDGLCRLQTWTMGPREDEH